MQVYMKTDMPFYGVQKPQRSAILKEIRKAHPITSRDDYRSVVIALWNLPHREEKYLAISTAQAFPKLIERDHIPMYEQMIREGAWWDFVDDLAIRLVGRAVLDARKKNQTWPSTLMDTWINDDDMWIRRSAIIMQVLHKEHTDEERLFTYCIDHMHETDFFIRKAIGWALRAHSYINPTGVKKFLKQHKSDLSGLSYREGARALVRKGKM